MVYQEFYAPCEKLASTSQLSADLANASRSSTIREYYGPITNGLSAPRVPNGFHGDPFNAGVDPSRCENFYGHSGPVVSISFSPDGAYVAAGSRAGELRMWSIAKSGLRRDMLGHMDMVAAISFSADGLLLVSGSADCTIRVWNAWNCQSRQLLTGHTAAVTAVAFSPDQRQIVSGSEDRTVRLWDIATGSCQIISGQKPQVTALTFSRDFEMAAISSYGSKPSLKLLSLSGPDYRFLSDLGSIAHAVAFSSSGRALAAGLADHTVQCWDLAKDESCMLIGHQAPVFAIAFSPDEKLVVSGAADGTLKVWNRAKVQNHLTINAEAKIWAVSFSPDGHTMAVGLGNGMVRVFERVTRQHTATTKTLIGSIRKFFT